MKTIIIFVFFVFNLQFLYTQHIKVNEPEKIPLEKGEVWEFSWSHIGRVEGDYYKIYIVTDTHKPPGVEYYLGSTEKSTINIASNVNQSIPISGYCALLIKVFNKQNEEITSGYTNEPFEVVEHEFIKTEKFMSVSGSLATLLADGSLPDENGTITISFTKKSELRGMNLHVSFDNSLGSLNEQGDESYTTFINLPNKGKYNFQGGGFTFIDPFCLDGQVNFGIGTWKKEDIANSIKIEKPLYVYAYSFLLNLDYRDKEYRKSNLDVKKGAVFGFAISAGLFGKGYFYSDSSIKDDVINLVGTSKEIFVGASLEPRIRINTTIIHMNFSYIWNELNAPGLGGFTYNLGVEVDGRLITF